MSNQNPKQPILEHDVRPHAPRASIVEPLNWIILTLDFMLMGAGIFMSWRYMQTSTFEDELRPEITQKVGVADTKSATNTQDNKSVPALKLNQNNERLGPEIQVDPNNIGRLNPFQKP